MKYFIAILSIVLATSSLLTAQQIPEHAQSRQQWEQFNTDNEQALELVWDQRSGRFSKMIGKTKSLYYIRSKATEQEATMQAA